MPRIEIEVDQILTVVTTIEAGPGDRLIVMRGMVVGMIEASAVREGDTAMCAAERSFSREDAARLIAQHGPIKARMLNDRLRLTRAERTRLVSALHRAAEDGLIRVQRDGRYPTYSNLNGT